MTAARLLIDGVDVAPLEVAATRRARSRGLLGRDGIDGALLIRPARQVHTFRMRFAIDVAHLDAVGRVLRVTAMPPGRLGLLVLGSRQVLEAGVGSFLVWGLRPGSTVAERPVVGDDGGSPAA